MPPNAQPFSLNAGRRGWELVDVIDDAGYSNVLATFAQFERRLISQRTKDALAAKKAQGVRLGRPRQLPQRIVNRILQERGEGKTLTAIAEGLNRDRVPTAQGGQRWYPSTVRAVLRSVSNE